MIIRGGFPFLKEKKHVISLVGAGGKTTLMYALAKCFTENGARTVVTTTTHIFRPEGRLWAKSPEEAKALWRGGSYAVVGRPVSGAPEGQEDPEKREKLTALPETDLDMYIQLADIVLIEADGAKRLPCKVPEEHEPVILEECDIVIAVMGMEALGKPLKAVCFRTEAAVRLLKAAPSEVVTEKKKKKIVASERGARKNVGGRDYYVVLNQCDDEARVRAGKRVIRLLNNQGIDKCVLTSFGR